MNSIAEENRSGCLFNSLNIFSKYSLICNCVTHMSLLTSGISGGSCQLQHRGSRMVQMYRHCPDLMRWDNRMLMQPKSRAVLFCLGLALRYSCVPASRRWRWHSVERVTHLSKSISSWVPTRHRAWEKSRACKNVGPLLSFKSSALESTDSAL